MESNETLIRCIYRYCDNVSDSSLFCLLTNLTALNKDNPNEKNAATLYDDANWVWLFYAESDSVLEFCLSQCNKNDYQIEKKEDIEAFHKFNVPKLSSDQAVSLEIKWNSDFNFEIVSVDDVMNDNEELFEKLPLNDGNYFKEHTENVHSDDNSENLKIEESDCDFSKISPKVKFKITTESLDSICGSSSEIEEIMSHQPNKLGTFIPSKNNSSEIPSSSSDKKSIENASKCNELPEEDEVFTLMETEDGLVDIDRYLMETCDSSEPPQNIQTIKTTPLSPEPEKSRSHIIIAKIHALLGFGSLRPKDHGERPQKENQATSQSTENLVENNSPSRTSDIPNNSEHSDKKTNDNSEVISEENDVTSIILQDEKKENNSNKVFGDRSQVNYQSDESLLNSSNIEDSSSNKDLIPDTGGCETKFNDNFSKTIDKNIHDTVEEEIQNLTETNKEKRNTSNDDILTNDFETSSSSLVNADEKDYNIKIKENNCKSEEIPFTEKKSIKNNSEHNSMTEKVITEMSIDDQDIKGRKDSHQDMRAAHGLQNTINSQSMCADDRENKSEIGSDRLCEIKKEKLKSIRETVVAEELKNSINEEYGINLNSLDRKSIEIENLINTECDDNLNLENKAADEDQKLLINNKFIQETPRISQSTDETGNSHFEESSYDSIKNQENQSVVNEESQGNTNFERNKHVNVEGFCGQLPKSPKSEDQFNTEFESIVKTNDNKNSNIKELMDEDHDDNMEFKREKEISNSKIENERENRYSEESLRDSTKDQGKEDSINYEYKTKINKENDKSNETTKLSIDTITDPENKHIINNELQESMNRKVENIIDTEEIINEQAYDNHNLENKQINENQFEKDTLEIFEKKNEIKVESLSLENVLHQSTKCHENKEETSKEMESCVKEENNDSINTEGFSQSVNNYQENIASKGSGKVLNIENDNKITCEAISKDITESKENEDVIDKERGFVIETKDINSVCNRESINNVSQKDLDLIEKLLDIPEINKDRKIENQDFEEFPHVATKYKDNENKRKESEAKDTPIVESPSSITKYQEYNTLIGEHGRIMDAETHKSIEKEEFFNTEMGIKNINKFNIENEAENFESKKKNEIKNHLVQEFLSDLESPKCEDKIQEETRTHITSNENKNVNIIELVDKPCGDNLKNELLDISKDKEEGMENQHFEGSSYHKAKHLHIETCTDKNIDQSITEQVINENFINLNLEKKLSNENEMEIEHFEEYSCGIKECRDDEDMIIKEVEMIGSEDKRNIGADESFNNECHQALNQENEYANKDNELLNKSEHIDETISISGNKDSCEAKGQYANSKEYQENEDAINEEYGTIVNAECYNIFNSEPLTAEEHSDDLYKVNSQLSLVTFKREGNEISSSVYLGDSVNLDENLEDKECHKEVNMLDSEMILQKMDIITLDQKGDSEENPVDLCMIIKTDSPDLTPYHITEEMSVSSKPEGTLNDYSSTGKSIYISPESKETTTNDGQVDQRISNFDSPEIHDNKNIQPVDDKILSNIPLTSCIAGKKSLLKSSILNLNFNYEYLNLNENTVYLSPTLSDVSMPKQKAGRHCFNIIQYYKSMNENKKSNIDQFTISNRDKEKNILSGKNVQLLEVDSNESSIVTSLSKESLDEITSTDNLYEKFVCMPASETSNVYPNPTLDVSIVTSQQIPLIEIANETQDSKSDETRHSAESTATKNVYLIDRLENQGYREIKSADIQPYNDRKTDEKVCFNNDNNQPQDVHISINADVISNFDSNNYSNSEISDCPIHEQFKITVDSNNSLFHDDKFENSPMLNPMLCLLLNKDTNQVKYLENQDIILMQHRQCPNNKLSIETSISSNQDSAVICDSDLISDTQSVVETIVQDDFSEEFIYHHPMTTSQTVDSLFLSALSNNKHMISPVNDTRYFSREDSHEVIFDDTQSSVRSQDSISKPQRPNQYCSLPIPPKSGMKRSPALEGVCDLLKKTDSELKLIQQNTYKIINDDGLYPDTLTSTKTDSSLQMDDIYYNIPYIDDESFYNDYIYNPIVINKYYRLARLADCDECTIASTYDLTVDESIKKQPKQPIVPITKKKQKIRSKFCCLCGCLSRKRN